MSQAPVTVPAQPPAAKAIDDTPQLHRIPRRWPVVLIGIGKLFKSAGLVVVYYILRALLSPDQHHNIEQWVDNARLEPHNWFINHYIDVVAKTLTVSPQTLHLLHLGVIIYAGLYLIEGAGLLFDKKWAEWMVIVTTAGFLPFEVVEICEAMTLGRCLLFAANVLVMIYLCWRIYRQAVIKREIVRLAKSPAKP